MAAFAGKSGSVSLAGQTAILKDWNVDQQGDEIDVTGFASSGDKAVIQGIRSWTFSASGFVDGTTHPTLPTQPIACTFVDGQNTWTGSGLVTSLRINTTITTAVELTFTGTGSGALSPT